MPITKGDYPCFSVVEWRQSSVQAARLPAEVCERIIDWVHLTKTSISPSENEHARRLALMACALTCRTWLYRSRFHLHKNVTFHDRYQLQRFVVVLRNNPNIGSFVRKLSAMRRGEGVQHQPETTHLIPLYLSGRLGNLESIYLRSCDWRALQPSFFLTIKHFTSVTTLVLQSVKIGTSRDLTKLVFALPKLSELTLREVDCLKVVPIATRDRARDGLPLTSVICRRWSKGYNLLECFRETCSARCLRWLELELDYELLEHESVKAFYQESNLESVTHMLFYVPLTFNEKNKITTEFMTLERVTNLYQLRYEANFTPSLFSLFTHMLSTIRSPHVSEMFIRFWMGLHGEHALKSLEECDWSLLDEILVKLKTLQYVCILFDYQFGSSSALDFLAKKLPSAHKRGVLVSEWNV